jgi:hypothetical protein
MERNAYEELRNLCFSPNRMIKSRKVRWAGHVVHMGHMTNASRTLVENLKERDHLADIGVDGRVISI